MITKSITYKIIKNKYIFCKDGTYFGLTKEQIKEFKLLLDEITTAKQLE